MVVREEIKKVLFENIFIPLATTIIFVSLIFYIFFKINESAKWIEHTDDVIFKIENLDKTILDAQNKRREYLLGIDNAFDGYIQVHDEVYVKIENIKKLVTDNPLQVQQTNNIKELFGRWHQAILPVFELYKKNPQLGMAEFKKNIGAINSIPIFSAIREMRAAEQQLRVEREKAAKGNLNYFMIFLLPILVIINGVTVFRGRRSILHIAEIYERQHQENIDQMSRLELENWLKQKENELSKKISSTATLQNLGDELLSYCVENFSVLAGAFYYQDNAKTDSYQIGASRGTIVPQLNNFNSLSASFKNLNKNNISVITCDELAAHWKIQLHHVTLIPQEIISVPFVFADQVIAVMELAFKSQVSERTKLFLTEMIDGLAGFINNQLAQQKMMKLIEEVEEKSLELKQQQEELSATNEELEERAQLLRESQLEIESRNHELEETNLLLEKQKNTLDERNTELERSRLSLTQKTSELEAANLHKSQFLANMSHELRTPLNSTLILSKILSENKDKNLSEKQVDYAKQIYRSGQDLLALINDILDLSKIESGHMTLELSDFTTLEIVESISANFSIQAEQKGLSFKVTNHQNITLYSDRLRLMQILNNLVSNAIKFTATGSIHVILEGDGSIFNILVEDSGVGIPEEKLQIIFDPFKQADESITRRYGGTGLGLSITKKIVEIFGGTVSVESKVNHGTTFKVQLPARVKEGEIKINIHNLSKNRLNGGDDLGDRFNQLKDHHSDSAANSSLAEIHNKQLAKKHIVLIVEDDEYQSNNLREMLSAVDREIMVARSAAVAYELLSSNKKIDCLLLDYHLPDYDALELLKKLTKNMDSKNLPVTVIHTAKDLTREQEAELRKFSRSIIVKGDRSKERVLAEIDLFLKAMYKADEKSIAVQNTIENEALRTVSVLLVDDDIRNVYAMTAVLEKAGAKVVMAQNGLDAVRMLENNKEEFDVILMDLMMPKMDGYEAIGIIRNQLKIADIPIIVLTAKAMVDDKKKAIDAGANDYLSKPVDIDRLITLVKVWVVK